MDRDDAGVTDPVRRRRLAAARRRATGLLLAVTVVFVATLVVDEPTASSTWLGYVRAAAEAAMVGGLADWFAVVALFRHPLGIPIPHTAVIPESKDGLGANLATFIADNFLDPDDLARRLTDADVAGRVGRWLADERHLEATTDHVVDVVVQLVDRFDADQVADILASGTQRGVESLPVADLLGNGLEAAITHGEHHRLVTAAVHGFRDAIIDHAPVLRGRLYAESPRWVPPVLDDLVFDRAAAGLISFLDEVAADLDHPVRGVVDQRLQDTAAALHNDPALQARVTVGLADLADHGGVRDWVAATWEHIAAAVHTAAAGDGAPLRHAIHGRLVDLARQLRDDPVLRRRVDGWVVALAPAVARESRHEIGALVAATVDRWDADETSDRLELWLGRDLQFVRINGTVVGGLVGLVLHTLTLL